MREDARHILFGAASRHASLATRGTLSAMSEPAMRVVFLASENPSFPYAHN